MNVKKCINGHFYDADKYQACPHCGAAPEVSAQGSKQNESTLQSQFIKQTVNAEAEVKQVFEKNGGKAFGEFDGTVKTPAKADAVKSTPAVSFAASARPAADPPAAAESAQPAKPETAANGQISCANCGKLISSTAKFCKYCGSRVAAKPAAASVFGSVKAAAEQFSSKVSETVKPAAEQVSAKFNETVKPAAEQFAAKISDAVKPSNQGGAAASAANTPVIIEKAAEAPEQVIEKPIDTAVVITEKAAETVKNIKPEAEVKSAAEKTAEAVQGIAPEAEAIPAAEKAAETPAEPEKISLQQAIRNAVSGSEGKTVGFFSKGQDEPENDTDPVVGWLVCTKGKHLGESFQIAAGRNSVGRGVSNKIVLSKDNAVSREKHVWITYDPKHRDFYIQPGEGSGLAYLNSETIMTTKKMAAKDVIEIGNGNYMLIPLCGEDFSWEDYI